MKFNVAIDGPTAAGKGTIAKRLAEKLGFQYLDTGIMYRCVAYQALLTGVPLNDEEKVVDLIRKMELQFLSQGKVLLNGKEVTLEIRQGQTSLAASEISMLPKVREEMVRQQQELAKEKGFVMDGRDIGTVVLPDAEIKIFLTASPEVRAQRRYLENQSRGIDTSLEVLTQEIMQRDKRDIERKYSPLKKAEDAFEIDTTEQSIEEVVKEIEEIISKKI